MLAVFDCWRCLNVGGVCSLVVFECWRCLNVGGCLIVGGV